MSENPTLKSNTAVTEAPASWNTKYTSPEGFTCQITLRADSGKELLEKAQAAITHLLQTGCMPCDNFTFRPRSNGNGSNGNAKSDNGSNGNGNGNGHAGSSGPEGRDNGGSYQPVPHAPDHGLWRGEDFMI